jgi:hypothetical protein
MVMVIDDKIVISADEVKLESLYKAADVPEYIIHVGQ